MDNNDIAKKVVTKLAQSYTKSDVFDLQKNMRDSDATALESLFWAFQRKHKLSRLDSETLIIDKLKAIYQLDTLPKHGEMLDALLSEIKQRTTWT